MFPARIPSLPWSVPVVRPAIPRSSMNAVTPLCFFARSTEAKTRKWSAMSARRDPHLLAVEPVDVAVPAGRGLEVAGVRADTGFGQAEGGELLAARLRDQPALALLLGPPLEEGQRVEADMDALDDTERGVGTFELLAQDREARVVHPAAAVRLGDRGAEEPELAHLLEQFAVDLALLVPVPDERHDLRLREGPHALLDEPVLVGQGEVDHVADRSRASPAEEPPVYSTDPEPRSPTDR